MLPYRKRNRTDISTDPQTFTEMQEKELVLKLKKEELFDPHVLLPHAELNSVVYDRVDSFVGKYKGTEMTLSIFTDPVSPQIQNVFREVYISHYTDELQKMNRYLRRFYVRVIVLIIISIIAILVGRALGRMSSEDTVLSYIVLNISGFCLWEIGYTQFSTRNGIEEKKRIIRALNARIDFQ